MATLDPLEAGRSAFESKSWGVAYNALVTADEREPLGPADLELLATAGYLTGRDEESTRAWSRAFEAYLQLGATDDAAGRAHWLSFGLVNRGEFARAAGWIGRAVKLLDDTQSDCVQRGYLTVIIAIQALWGGNADEALAGIDRASAIAVRYADADLIALTTMAQGKVLIELGRIRDAVALFDEVMVAVTSDRLSASIAGLTYCAVISACHEIFDLRRAQEWSAALTNWCDAQSDLVPYTGSCHIHRAEIMQVHGDWADAVAVAEHAHERSLLSTNETVAGQAFYLMAEVRRLRGEFALAEQAYREASRLGREPQPGLALLRAR